MTASYHILAKQQQCLWCLRLLVGTMTASFLRLLDTEGRGLAQALEVTETGTHRYHSLKLSDSVEASVGVLHRVQHKKV